MFVELPFVISLSVQKLALIVNTLLLVGVFIGLEFAQASGPKSAKRSLRSQLRLSVPVVALFGGMFIYAIVQGAGA